MGAIAHSGGISGAALLLHGVPVHAGLQALAQPAAPALVPVRFVDGTVVVVGLATILPISPDGALEETCATVAGVDAVVLARRIVGAHLAGHIQQYSSLTGSHSR